MLLWQSACVRSSKRDRYNNVSWAAHSGSADLEPLHAIILQESATNIPILTRLQVFTFPDLVKLHCLIGHAATVYSLDINATEE